MKHFPGRLLVLLVLTVSLALVLPGTTQAASFSEVKKLTASDAQADDNFGIGVAISGDTAIVAARFEDAEGTNAGAAYVYQRGQGGQDNWGEVKKLTASDAEAGDYFGTSVAIDGDIAIVGARFEDAGGNEAGAAYIFQRNQGGPDNWGEVTKLTASDAQATDWFGATVAVSGDTAVVGAYLEDAGGDFAGAAYIFQRNEGGANAWGEVTKLTASDAQAEDEFGASIAVSGDTVIVGAFLEDAGGDGAGAVYVFQRDQGGANAWGEVTKLTASDAETGDSFGVSVAISGDTVVVGANLEDLAGASAGAAYVFQRDQGSADNWGELTKLAASDAEAGDFFGSGVAVDGDTAIVGAFREDDGGNNAGAAYVFARSQGGPDNWGELKKLTASDAQAGDFFGLRVAVSGDSAIVGAYHEDAGGIDAGAAYLFESLAGPPPVLPGDANCDGSVSSIDAALVLQFVAGLLSALACQDAADANSDGEVTSVDAALILQFVAGLVGSLEACVPSSRQYAEAPPLTIDAETTYIATIATSRGDIVLELFSDVPVTTNNFVFLAREGFYDCSTFHRVIPGFVAQGGDPTGTGIGGPGYSIPDEDDGDHGFDAGVIGMAHAGPNTAGSQFFITYTAQRQLDADFTAFGRVINGMDVMLQLTPGDPGNRSAPLGDIIETITIEER